jgi:uncharacterized coiled-coil protein SlyX
MSSFYDRQRNRDSGRREAGVGSSRDADRLSAVGSYTSDQNGSSMEKRIAAQRQQIEHLQGVVRDQQQMIDRLGVVIQQLVAEQQARRRRRS